MKIYVLWDRGFYASGSLYGAFSTEELAREALDNFRPNQETNWQPTGIAEIELDALAHEMNPKDLDL